jgi:hypothetical protein
MPYTNNAMEGSKSPKTAAQNKKLSAMQSIISSSTKDYLSNAPKSLQPKQKAPTVKIQKGGNKLGESASKFKFNKKNTAGRQWARNDAGFA